MEKTRLMIALEVHRVRKHDSLSSSHKHGLNLAATKNCSTQFGPCSSHWIACASPTNGSARLKREVGPANVCSTILHHATSCPPIRLAPAITVPTRFCSSLAATSGLLTLLPEDFLLSTKTAVQARPKSCHSARTAARPGQIDC